MAMGFFINNKDCYGCKTCSMACKGEKQSGKQVLLRRVREIVQDEPPALSFLSMSCNHCEEPACMKNCPVGAYTKLENGIVQQNHDLCIGCQACIKACPYAAPSYDEAEGKTYKCDMCVDRLNRGLAAACVASCPGMNLDTGDMNELQQKYQADIVSDDDVETRPRFVITKDPVLIENPAKAGLA